MAPEAVTAERVYWNLKRAVLSGHFQPGSILVVTTLAREYGTSIAPVRDCMQRLVGERLIESHIGGGFRMPEVTEEGLRHLYQWHGQLIRLALKSSQSGIPHPDFQPSFAHIEPGDSHAIAELTAALFLHIAARSASPEYIEAVRSAGERLHATRVRETPTPNSIAELEQIWSATLSGPTRDAQEAVRTYHRRRLRQISRLAWSDSHCEGNHPMPPE